MIKYDKKTFTATVASGNIRYQAYPAGLVAVVNGAPGAWSELWVAGAGPIVDYWVTGFTFGTLTGLVVINETLLIDFGWGGADGAATAPANVIVTNWPLTFVAVAAALGPVNLPAAMLPRPVKVPANARMAVRIADSPTGVGLALVEFHVICATAVGA
jgi:hypothetical protein